MAVSNSTDRFNGVVASKAIKVPCIVATIADITLSGSQVIDSVTVVSEDRVLVRAQTNAVENGIYIVRDAAWDRAADWDGNRDVTQGTLITAWDSLGAATQYIVSTEDPIQINTTAITIDVYSQGAAGVSVEPGSITNAMLRWDGIDTYREADRVRATVDGADFRIYDAGLTEYMNVTHSGSGAVISMSNAAHNVQFQNDVFISSSDLTVTGMGQMDQLLLPQVDDSANPVLAFGDGNTGFYEPTDNTVRFVSGGIISGVFGAIGIGTQIGAFILNEVPTAINPSIVPNSADIDTGLGAAALDQLSLIAGGVELMRLTEDAGGNTVAMQNYTFDVDQTVGAGQDDYVLTYDNASGLISLEEAVGLASGTTDGQIPIWDQTTDQAWEPSTNFTFRETGGGGTGHWYIEYEGDSVLHYQATDGGVLYCDQPVFRLDLGNRLDLWPATGSERPYIRGLDTAGPWIHFSAESVGSMANTGALFDMPINIAGQLENPTSPGGPALFGKRESGFASALLQTQGNAIAHPVTNYTQLVYGFSTSTTATDPSENRMRLNNAAFASVTEIYVADLDYTENDSGWFWGMVNVGDIITLHQDTDVSRWVRFTVDAITDNTGWWTIDVTPIDQAGPGSFNNLSVININWWPASDFGGDFLPLAGGSMDAGSHTIFPLENDAVTPTLAFGDGDTGFYEDVDDSISVAIAGTRRWIIGGAIDGNVTFGPRILNGTPSGTNPTLMPDKTDTDTGIGRTAADQLSLIAGSVEMLRLVETGLATTDQIIIGPAGTIGAAATPGLAFGDGDTGFWESADDILRVAVAGAERWRFQAESFTSQSSSGPRLLDESSSATNPTVAPSFDDSDTGIGHAAADQLSLIAGGVELGRFTEDAGGNTVALQNLVFDVDQTVGAGQDNFILTYDNSTGLISLEAAAAATTFDGLADTNMTTIANEDVLVWDSTPGEWINTKTLAGLLTFSNLIHFSGSVTGNSADFANDLHMLDNSAVKLGTGSGGGGDVLILWDGVDLEITGTSANHTINFRDGFHLRLWDSSDTDWLDIHNNGANIILTESGLGEIQFPAAGTLGLNMVDNTLERAILQDYSIESSPDDVSGTTVTFLYSDGPAFECDMEAATGNVTATLSGGPPSGTYGQITVKMTQDTTVRTLSWAGGTFRWAGGTAHPITTTANGFSIYTFETWDGGTTWYGSGADYS